MALLKNVDLKDMMHVMFSSQNSDFPCLCLEDDKNPRLEGSFEKVEVIESQALGQLAKKTVSLMQKRNYIMVCRQAVGMVALEVYIVKNDFTMYLNKAYYKVYKDTIAGLK